MPTGENNFLPVILADFSRLYGTVSPVGIKPFVKVYYAGTSQIATNTKGVPVGQPLIVSADGSGNYFIDFIPAGTYDLSFEAPNYRTDNKLFSFIVPSSQIVTNAEFKMKRAAFSSTSVEQNSAAIDDPSTALILPAGSMLDLFAVDIWLTNLNVVSPDMETAASKSKTIQGVSDASRVRVYLFDMTGYNGDRRDEQELKNDVILKLHYDASWVSAQGWDESKLAVYYWRPMTKEWVRVGGLADGGSKTVSFKAGYLHRYYAIFGDKGSALKGAPGFVSVRTDPKVFTPRASDRMYRNIKISIGFEEAHDQYEVKIYDMRGNMIKSFVRSAEYKEGEVYWDGKDDEGYDVKSGVYVFRILADGKLYSGTIVIAR